MMTPIHILNLKRYGSMVTFVLALGSFQTARHIHIRWLKTVFSYTTSNAIVKSVLVIVGLFFVPISVLFLDNFLTELISLIIGLTIGILIVLFEVKSTRDWNRSQIAKCKTKKIYDHQQKMSFVKQNLFLTSHRAMQPAGIQIREKYRDYASDPDLLNYGLLAVIIVAIAEEFLYRGFILSASSFSAGCFISVIFLVLSVVTFSFSHVVNSWYDFYRKLPLTLSTSLCFLTLHSLIAPILIHLTLNIFAFIKMHDQRKMLV